MSARARSMVRSRLASSLSLKLIAGALALPMISASVRTSASCESRSVTAL
jgi:hypothetical protein